MKPVNVKWCVLLVFVCMLQGCAYSAASIRGRVIDAQTRQPVAGVNVAAVWSVAYSTFHNLGNQSMEVAEAVTDQNGWFVLPAWGPRALPAGAPARAFMTGGSPNIQFFKSGYRYKVVANQVGKMFERSGGPHRVSEWNEKTIEIARFAGTRAEYAERTGQYYLNSTHIPCAFKKAPRMLVALEREAQALDKEGLRHAIPRLGDLERRNDKDNCGSVAEFFAPYLTPAP